MRAHTYSACLTALSKTTMQTIECCNRQEQPSNNNRQLCKHDTNSHSPQMVTDSDTDARGLAAVQVYTAHSVLCKPVINKLPSSIISKRSFSLLIPTPLTVQDITGEGLPSALQSTYMMIE